MSEPDDFTIPLRAKTLLATVESVSAMAAEIRQLRTERDAMRAVVERLLLSADCTWAERGLGHDWRDAVAEAITALGEVVDAYGREQSCARCGHECTDLLSGLCRDCEHDRSRIDDGER